MKADLAHRPQEEYTASTLFDKRAKCESVSLPKSEGTGRRSGGASKIGTVIGREKLSMVITASMIRVDACPPTPTPGIPRGSAVMVNPSSRCNHRLALVVASASNGPQIACQD